MVIWTFHCQYCHAAYESDQSMNQTLWDMGDARWLVLDEEKMTAVCPEHSGLTAPTEAKAQWIVNCYTCDYEDVVFSIEDAKYAQSEHDCSEWIDPPDVRIIGPEEQIDRKKRAEKYREERNKERVQELAHAFYVAFLIDQDQQRRKQLDNNPYDSEKEKKRRMALIGLGVVVFLLIVFFMAGCGANAY